MAYTRARSSWSDWPLTTTLVRAQDFEKWDAAVYALKNELRDPRDFGTNVGTGLTDTTDTDAINAAIANGPTFIPGGTYNVTTLNYATNSFVLGAGNRNTTINQISGVSGPIMQASDPSLQNTRVTIGHLFLSGFNNQTANTGGLLLGGVQESRIIGLEVSFTNTAAIQIKGFGSASSGDAMRNVLVDPKISSLVSGAGIRLTPATGGGSHPDGTRVFGGRIISSVGVGIQGDPPSADSAGFLGADGCEFYGVDQQDVPTPLDFTGQSWRFFGGRWEKTAGTMTININNPTPTNFPSSDNAFFGMVLPTHGSPASLVINNNGTRTSFYGQTEAGGVNRWGTGANRIGFYGASPVAQQARPVTLGDVITVLVNLGLTA